MTLKYDFGGDMPYEYDVEYKELRKALVELLCEKTNYVNGTMFEPTGAYQTAMYVVYEMDIVDAIANNFEDDLYEYFRDKAFDQYESDKETEIEEDCWYGTKNDVLGL